MWCLGDLVGYGAEPDACVELARRHAAVCLAGNHDLGVRGDLPLEEFSRGAALAARVDAARRSPSETRALPARRSSPQDLDEAVGLFHASPRDPVWEYVLSPLQAELCFDVQAHRVCLIGHSHVALSFVAPAGEPATGETRGADDELDLDGRRVADQPGQRRPAARRRPARRVAAAGHRRLARRSTAGPSTTSPAPRPRSGPRGCPTRWPSACLRAVTRSGDAARR